MIVFISPFMLYDNPMDSHLGFLYHSNYFKYMLKPYIATTIDSISFDLALLYFIVIKFINGYVLYYGSITSFCNLGLVLKRFYNLRLVLG